MHWTKDLKDKANNLGRYTNDLELKNAYLREELSKISVGLTWNSDSAYDRETALRLRAAKALSTEATMQNRKTSTWIC